MKEDRKLKDMRLAIKHLINAQDCGSHVKYYIKKDMPRLTNDIEDAMSLIERSWSLIVDTKLVREHPELMPSPLRIGKAVWFVMSPLRILSEGINELRLATRNLRKYPEIKNIQDMATQALWKLQEIEIELKEAARR